MRDDGRCLSYHRFRDLHIEPTNKDRLIEAISALGADDEPDD
ncbi:hypothetical protein [Nocardia sp. SSK8]